MSNKKVAKLFQIIRLQNQIKFRIFEKNLPYYQQIFLFHLSFLHHNAMNQQRWAVPQETYLQPFYFFFFFFTFFFFFFFFTFFSYQRRIPTGSRRRCRPPWPAPPPTRRPSAGWGPACRCPPSGCRWRKCC